VAVPASPPPHSVQLNMPQFTHSSLLISPIALLHMLLPPPLRLLRLLLTWLLLLCLLLSCLLRLPLGGLVRRPLPRLCLLSRLFLALLLLGLPQHLLQELLLSLQEAKVGGSRLWESEQLA